MDVTQRLVSRSCPFCQNSAEDAQVLSYGSSEWPMIECNKCHFVYLKRAPVYERLSEEFAWEKTSETERQVREEREPVKQGLSRAFKHFRQKVLKRNKLPELIEKYIPGGRVLDIYFRMLQPHELAAAMGFPRGYKWKGTKTETVKMIGNAVSVDIARALCKSLLTEPKGRLSDFTMKATA